MSKRDSGRKLEWTEAENQIILEHQARAKAAGNRQPWKGQAGAEGLLPDRDDLVDDDLYRRAKKLNERTRSRAKAAAAPRQSVPPPARAPKGMTSRHRGVRCPAAVRGLRPSSTREPFLDARREEWNRDFARLRSISAARPARPKPPPDPRVVAEAVAQAAKKSAKRRAKMPPPKPPRAKKDKRPRLDADGIIHPAPPGGWL